ncbi:hypothetical protein E1202_17675 [Saccharopolyspora karakumensis]|uniref:Uncharacterized protein n=1 Tax=Saccharopolyspora karakumensis TaxID=2530386 RepID=A0A4R5BS91_9PSEU|nr:hypothetical protein E1202_17675 [Saccharopolyspora karakumensis]
MIGFAGPARSGRSPTVGRAGGRPLRRPGTDQAPARPAPRAVRARGRGPAAAELAAPAEREPATPRPRTPLRADPPESARSAHQDLADRAARPRAGPARTGRALERSDSESSSRGAVSDESELSA